MDDVNVIVKAINTWRIIVGGVELIHELKRRWLIDDAFVGTYWFSRREIEGRKNAVRGVDSPKERRVVVVEYLPTVK